MRLLDTIAEWATMLAMPAALLIALLSCGCQWVERGDTRGIGLLTRVQAATATVEYKGLKVDVAVYGRDVDNEALKTVAVAIVQGLAVLP
jgi:hypothetical protein